MRSPLRAVLEQLPLTLQRNFKLMKNLDEQVAGEFAPFMHAHRIGRLIASSAHLQAVPSVLEQYLQLRLKLAQDVVMVDAKPNPDRDRVAVPRERERERAASFSSASLTPITDSPSTRSASLPNSRNVQDDSTNIVDDEEEEEEETEEPEMSFDSVGPTSTQLITRVATLATDAVRGSLEKVNLAKAAFEVVSGSSRW